MDKLFQSVPLLLILCSCVTVPSEELLQNMNAATDELNNLISGATTNTNCEIQIATCVTFFLGSTATRATAEAAVKCVDSVDCYFSASLTDFKNKVLGVLRGIVQSFCMIGWFGSRCQYLCHCKNNLPCDDKGRCETGCDIGWFGTGCQLVNLATLPDVLVTMTPTRTSTTWLTDGDDTTCNGNGDITSLQLSWNTSYPFTWLRMTVHSTSQNLLNVSLTFITSRNDTFNCINKQVSVVDSTTVDYRCDMTETITQLKLEGPALKSLCSFYISGGRNVALRQSAEQTSTHFEGNLSCNASLAVDGGIKCLLLDGSTSHTFDTERNPSWSLTLDTPKVVNRVVIYNRADCCRYRLKHFEFTTFDTNNNMLWTYRDPIKEDTAIYTFSRILNNAVSKIRIFPTNIETFDTRSIISLCEVFIYGECTPGVWGLDCTQKCPEECLYSCQQDTGKCLLWLDQSDTPQSGTVCAPGTNGMNCQQNCSDTCFNRTCNSVTGECDGGCNGYSNPPESTIPLNVHQSSSIAFEAGIGIGIAVDDGAILLILVVVLLIYRARHYNMSGIKQERVLNQGTQPSGPNINQNEETHVMRQGRELANYNELRQTQEYQHAYEATNMSDTDTGYDESDSSSRHNSQTSTYDTIDKY